MVDIILALILPLLLMVVITRVVFSIYGALIVTLMIMIFAIRIHEMSVVAILLAIASLALGWKQARKLLQKKPGM